LRVDRGRDGCDVHVGERGCGLDVGCAGDGDEQCGLDRAGRFGPDRRRQRAAGAAGEYVAADDFGVGGAGAGVDGVAGDVDGVAGADVCLSVAAV